METKKVRKAREMEKLREYKIVCLHYESLWFFFQIVKMKREHLL